MWGVNFGYCGETSFITSGMYYGQYLSQYDVRRLNLKPGLTQSKEEGQVRIALLCQKLLCFFFLPFPSFICLPFLFFSVCFTFLFPLSFTLARSLIVF